MFRFSLIVVLMAGVCAAMYFAGADERVEQITGAHIRPRPAVLAPCTIPEYLSRPLSESRAAG